MDQRVLLANANKRYDAIFQGLGILNKQAAEDAENILAAFEVLHAKLIEIDNKLDSVMVHLGLTPEESDIILAAE
jgi:hypothetical protein